MVAQSLSVNAHLPQDRREPCVRVGVQEFLCHVLAERSRQISRLSELLSFDEKATVAVIESPTAVAANGYGFRLLGTS